MASKNSEGLTIKQTAQALKVSEMTIRRRIRAGNIAFKLVRGKFGEEYRITELSGSGPAAPTPAGPDPADLLAMIKALQEENRDLALALGEARSKVLLLQEARKPWYKRLFNK